MKNKKSGVDAASVAAAPVAGRTFTSGDICQLTGIPYRTLDFWARSGFAAPHISAAQGIGTDRLYSLETSGYCAWLGNCERLACHRGKSSGRWRVQLVSYCRLAAHGLNSSLRLT